MNLQSKRCLIRNFKLNDIPSFMEYRNDMQWMQYQGYKGKSKENYENDLLGKTTVIQGKQFAIVSIETGDLIGDIYLKQETNVYWLGYTIHPKFARQGYASESITAVIEQLKEHSEAVVKAGVLPNNTASINLLEKLGFSYAGEEAGELIYKYDLSDKR